VRQHVIGDSQGGKLSAPIGYALRPSLDAQQSAWFHLSQALGQFMILYYCSLLCPNPCTR